MQPTATSARPHPLFAAVIAHLSQAKVYARDFVTRLTTYPILLFITLALWRAIHQQAGGMGVDFTYLAGYYALTLAITRLIPFGTVANTVAESIYSGELAITLARPFRVWWLPLAQLLSSAAIALAVVSPLAVAAIFLTQIALPTLGAFAAAFLLSAFLQFWFFYLIGSLAFWMERIRGVIYGISLALGILSGALVPLRLFPETVQTLLGYTPFPYFLYYPVDILLHPEAITTRATLVLLGWSIALPIAALMLHRRGLKHFTGHGI